MTGSDVAPADDIFQAYFQESGCWMPAALLSTYLLLYCRFQNLLATLPCAATDWQEARAHWKCVSLSKLPGVRLRGNNCLIKTSPFLLPPAPSLILVSSSSQALSLPHAHRKLVTGVWVFWFWQTVGVNCNEWNCPVRLKRARLRVCCLSKLEKDQTLCHRYNVFDSRWSTLSASITWSQVWAAHANNN